MTVSKKVKYHPDGVYYFKELPFYNQHIKKPKIKHLKNIDLLPELPFYKELNVIKTNCAFKGYELQSRISLGKKIQLTSLKKEFKNKKFQIKKKILFKSN